MKEKIILIGGGGHCKSCIDVIGETEKFQIAGIVDVHEKLHEKVLGYEVIASDEDIPSLAKEYENFLITIGQIKSSDRRIQLYEIIKKTGSCLPVIISPYAYVSRHAKIEEGTIVMHNAVINIEAKVGKNCIVNTKALIEHDASIGDHCHISTGVVINGGVQIGNKTFIGSNAVTREYIEIGANCVIGTGAKILKSIDSNSIIKTIPNTAY